MKSKFLAGLVASLICLVIVVGAAIIMVVVFDMDESGNMPKIIAFATIGLWLGLYGWLKPKPTLEQSENKSTAEVSSKINKDRNSYH